jgi:putative inorganic carbon (HCO3(-)) transporter
MQREERTFVFKTALNVLHDFWLTGSGAGSYYSIFPNYRDNQSMGFYDFAHNDFLQIGIEYGLIGSLFFGLIVVLCFTKAIQAQITTSYCHFKRHGLCGHDGNHEYYDSL